MDSKTQWNHEDLANDLASHLKAPNTMVWTDIQLGPSGSPRPDVYLMMKSFIRPHPIAYECKVSKSDFIRDVSSGKWAAYLKYAYAVIFAVPEGLATKNDIPSKCGLIIRYGEKWRLAKRPVLEPVKIPESALIKLLIDGVMREGPNYRAMQWKQYERMDKFTKKFGAEAARWVSESVSARENIGHAREMYNDMLDKARKDAERTRASALSSMPAMWNSLIEILGLNNDAEAYEINNAIRGLRDKKDDTVVAALERVLDQMERLVNANRRYTQK